MCRSLLQNKTTILLQNATKVYYKMRQVYYCNMRQFYYKMCWYTLLVGCVATLQY